MVHGNDADVTLRQDPRNEVVDVAFPGGRQVKRIRGSGVRGKQGVCTMSKGIEVM